MKRFQKITKGVLYTLLCAVILETRIGRFLALVLIPAFFELIIAIWLPELLLPMIAGNIFTAIFLVATNRDLERWY